VARLLATATGAVEMAEAVLEPYAGGLAPGLTSSPGSPSWRHDTGGS
jgi:hypothetical protein